MTAPAPIMVASPRVARRRRRWVTLTVSDVRPTAAGIAADAYGDRFNERRETPRQVRVVTAGQLRREGGRRDLNIADAGIARGDATR